MSEKAFTVRYLCNSCNKEIQQGEVILGENGEYCNKDCQAKHEKELEESHTANCPCPCHEDGQPDSGCDCRLGED